MLFINNEFNIVYSLLTKKYLIYSDQEVKHLERIRDTICINSSSIYYVDEINDTIFIGRVSTQSDGSKYYIIFKQHDLIKEQLYYIAHIKMFKNCSMVYKSFLPNTRQFFLYEKIH